MAEQVKTSPGEKTYPHASQNKFYRWFIVGIVLSAGGFITDISSYTFASQMTANQANGLHETGLLVVIVGLVLTLTLYLFNEFDVLSKAVGQTIVDISTTKTSLTNLSDIYGTLNSRIDTETDQLRQEMEELRAFERNTKGIQYTPIDENISIAVKLLRALEPYDEVLETSSHVNETAYEDLFVSALNPTIQFRRLLCYASDDKKMAGWHEKMMDAAKDTENRYTKLRESTAEVAHLPRQLDADMLIVKKYSPSRNLALIGFRTQQSSSEGKYKSGVSVEGTNVRNLADDLNELFAYYWKEAKEHEENAPLARGKDQCPCLRLRRHRTT
jgi:hypothetical protein